MAFEITWSEAASEDLKQIVLYIAQDNSTAARRLAVRVLSHIETASRFPFSNRAVPEKSDESIRETILKPYRIIYHADKQKNAIHILRIWHAARGMPEIE